MPELNATTTQDPWAVVSEAPSPAVTAPVQTAPAASVAATSAPDPWAVVSEKSAPVSQQPIPVGNGMSFEPPTNNLFGVTQHDIGTGVIKGAKDTVHTVGQFLNRHLGIPMPQEILNPGDTQSKTPGETAGKFGEAIGEFMLGDEAVKGLSLGERLGMTQKVIKLATEHPYLAKVLGVGMNALRTGSVGTGEALAKGATPGQALGTGATTAAGGAVLETAGEVIPKIEMPDYIRHVVKGGDVVQPQTEEALRSSVKAGGKEAGISTVQPQSLRTVVEEPIHSLDASAKSLYRQIDNAAGTDFKALNEKLDNTEYQIRQLTETEEDVAKEAALEKSRTAIMDKIEAAKEQAKAAGVDPKVLDQADAHFRQARALSDLETKVFKNPNVVGGNQAMGTPETVNVDSAVKALQKLQDSSKYGGSRLEQALGKDGASQLLKDLYDAQRVGTKALSRQQFAKWAARIVGLGTAEEVVRHAWQQ